MVFIRIEHRLSKFQISLLTGKRFNNIPFGFSLFWYLWGIIFQLFKLHCLAKDHWGGFSARNAHMVHIVINPIHIGVYRVEVCFYIPINRRDVCFISN